MSGALPHAEKWNTAHQCQILAPVCALMQHVWCVVALKIIYIGADMRLKDSGLVIVVKKNKKYKGKVHKKIYCKIRHSNIRSNTNTSLNISGSNMTSFNEDSIHCNIKTHNPRKRRNVSTNLHLADYIFPIKFKTFTKLDRSHNSSPFSCLRITDKKQIKFNKYLNKKATNDESMDCFKSITPNNM